MNIGTGSLFDVGTGTAQTTAPAPKPKPKAKPTRPYRRVADPWGEPDNKGLFWCDKFAKDVAKEENNDVREMLILVAAEWPCERFQKLLKLMNKYARAKLYDQQDWKMGMGV